MDALGLAGETSAGAVAATDSASADADRDNGVTFRMAYGCNHRHHRSQGHEHHPCCGRHRCFAYGKRQGDLLRGHGSLYHNGTTFKLFNKGLTTKLAATVTYQQVISTDASTYWVILDPANALKSGATYKAVVTT